MGIKPAIAGAIILGHYPKIQSVADIFKKGQKLTQSESLQVYTKPFEKSTATCKRQSFSTRMTIVSGYRVEYVKRGSRIRPWERADQLPTSMSFPFRANLRPAPFSLPIEHSRSIVARFQTNARKVVLHGRCGPRCASHSLPTGRAHVTHSCRISTGTRVSGTSSAFRHRGGRAMRLYKLVDVGYPYAIDIPFRRALFRVARIFAPLRPPPPAPRLRYPIYGGYRAGRIDRHCMSHDPLHPLRPASLFHLRPSMIAFDPIMKPRP